MIKRYPRSLLTGLTSVALTLFLLSCEPGVPTLLDHCDYFITQLANGSIREWHVQHYVVYDNKQRPHEVLHTNEVGIYEPEDDNIWRRWVGGSWYWIVKQDGWYQRWYGTGASFAASEDKELVPEPGDHGRWGTTSAFVNAPSGSLEKCALLGEQLTELSDILVPHESYSFDCEVAEALGDGLNFNSESARSDVTVLWGDTLVAIYPMEPPTEATGTLRDDVANYLQVFTISDPSVEWDLYEVSTTKTEEPTYTELVISITHDEDSLFELTVTSSGFSLAVEGTYLGEPIGSDIEDHPILVYDALLDTLTT